MRSILFIKDMHDATVIKKNKTETRRAHGLDEINVRPDEYQICSTGFSLEGRNMVTFYDGKNVVHVKSRFKRGEILYIAEPMWIMKEELLTGPITALDIPHQYHYDMTSTQIDTATKLKAKGMWRKVSPLLLKQEYGRQFIKISDVGCERVQDISDEAILREGISPPETEMQPGMLKAMYAALFDRVNRPGAWDHNPFVFVYLYEYLPDFKRRLQ